MRRLDRAMYAFFLLALLADLARSQVPASMAGESAGGSILSAANSIRGQVRIDPAGDSALVSRRSDRRSQPAAQSEGSSFTLARLARLFSGPGAQSTFVLLLAVPFVPDFTCASSPASGSPAPAPPHSVFEHTASPAP